MSMTLPESFWAVAEQVSMLSALVVVPAALGGLVFGVIGVVAALKLRSGRDASCRQWGLSW